MNIASVFEIFTQPTVKRKDNYNTYSSYWVGIGGYNTSRLVQCGTAGQYNHSDDKKSYYAWYEYLGAGGAGVNEIMMDSLKVHAGDKIYAYCTFEEANNKANFYIANNITGKSASVVVHLKANTYYDGTSAEWITERPTVNGKYGNLSNYTTCEWSNCKVYTRAGNTLGISSLNSILLNMTNANGEKLSVASALSGNSFHTTWKAYN